MERRQTFLPVGRREFKISQISEADVIIIIIINKDSLNVRVCVFPSAQAIGTRLSELCHSDSESPANILGYIYDEETKRRMRKEDEEEDYLDDSECGIFV